MTTQVWGAERAAEVNADLESAPALDVVRWALEEFGDDIVVASSMQTAVLEDLVSRVRPGVPVVFLDTGYHFTETIGTRDAVRVAYPVTLVDVTPRRTVAEQDAEEGPRLFERNPDRCCALRKVEPLERALAPYRAWITGLRRADSPSRALTPVVDWDAKRSMVKVNPIVTWSDEELERYVEEHGVIANPLLQLGYPSIGCEPCTRAVAPGEDARAGRWSGRTKTECGLHG
jgi:phosphoadenosine phosphosulfate reductase